jgi:hypothetical protein
MPTPTKDVTLISRTKVFTEGFDPKPKACFYLRMQAEVAKSTEQKMYGQCSYRSIVKAVI